jgi:erythromycin esterase-like protein
MEVIANIENLNEKERLFETLPTIWRTESVLNLINYIDSVSRNTSLLIQMGLDIGGAYTDRFPNYLHKFFSAVSQIVADSVFSIDIELQRKWVMWQSSFNTKGILDNKEKIVYQHYYNFLISLLDSQNEKLSLSETQNLLLKTCLKSRIKLCDLLSIKDSTTAGFRDKVMSENLLHFIKEIYPEKKIIIWAAHGHISKSAKDTYSTKDNIESMIELLPTEIKDTILCIDLKPFESAPKPIKKRLLKCEDDVVFFKTHTPAYELYEFEKLKSEFDGIIFCRNKKSINNYAILQNEYKK